MPQIYKIAVLADIHGNLPGFETVLRDLKCHEPLDAILVAGDFIGGPGQQTILDRLMELNAVTIQGNNEQGIVRLFYGSAPKYFSTTRQFTLLRWVRDNLNPKQLEYLCGIPEQRRFVLPGSDPILIVHGSPRKVDENVLPNRECHPQLFYEPVMLNEVLQGVIEPVIVFGHSHLPWQASVDGKLAMNPGAVSFPENGFIGSQYAILYWDGGQWNPQFHQVTYDLDRLKADYQESGFLDVSPLARVILQSILTGKEYFGVYLAHLRHIARAWGYNDLPYFPDAVWAEAEKTFPWII